MGLPMSSRRSERFRRRPVTERASHAAEQKGSPSKLL